MDSSLRKKRKIKDVDGVPDANGATRLPKDTEPVDPQPSSSDLDNDDDDDDDDNTDLPESNDAAANDAPILPPAAESDSFEHLNLSEKTMKAIRDMEFANMTEIQRRVRSSLLFVFSYYMPD